MDSGKIPHVRESFKLKGFGLIRFEVEEIEIGSNCLHYRDPGTLEWKDSLKYAPFRYWQNYFERWGFQGK